MSESENFFFLKIINWKWSTNCNEDFVKVGYLYLTFYFDWSILLADNKPKLASAFWLAAMKDAFNGLWEGRVGHFISTGHKRFYNWNEWLLQMKELNFFFL